MSISEIENSINKVLAKKFNSITSVELPPIDPPRKSRKRKAAKETKGKKTRLARSKSSGVKKKSIKAGSAGSERAGKIKKAIEIKKKNEDVSTAVKSPAGEVEEEDDTMRVISNIICGGSGNAVNQEDPLAATFAIGYTRPQCQSGTTTPSSTPLLQGRSGPVTSQSSIAPLKALAERKAEEYVKQEELLAQAHEYFEQLNIEEQRLNKIAAMRLREMKRVNRAGGTKDGFKFVIPRSAKEIVKQMIANGEPDASTLSSHFLGDGVQETKKRPSRKAHKKRSIYTPEIYNAARWARNAEKFLSRTRGGAKNLAIRAQQSKRSIKKL